MSGKSPSFVFLFLYSVSSLFSLCLLPFLSFILFFLIFFFLLFLIHRIPLSLFAPTHFLISSFSLSFSFFLHFLFSLLFWIAINCMVQKVGETSSHFPPLPHVIPLFFFLIFLIFLFLLFPPLDTWLNVSHSHKCTTWLMPCVTPLGFHVASTCPCHVSPDTRCLEKHEILTVLESDGVTRFRETNSMVKSVLSSEI